MRFTNKSISKMTDKQLQHDINALRASYTTSDWANQRDPRGYTDETMRLRCLEAELSRRGCCQQTASMVVPSRVHGRLSK